MSKRLFSPEQIADLLRNPNVAKCSSKSISYKQEFKIWAIKQYDNGGLSAKDIFSQAGFDILMFKHDELSGILRRWRRLKRIKGDSAFEQDGRGKSVGNGQGRPKTKWNSDALQIEYLKAKVAYLQAENDFLARLRSGKTE
jgi:hypothetical protein